MEDKHLLTYVEELQTLFELYKKEPSEINSDKIYEVVDHFVNYGYRYPLTYEVFITGSEKLRDRLFKQKGLNESDKV